MITQPSPAKQEPFTYTPIELPGPAITQQAEVDSNPDTLRPAWGVQQDARVIAETVTPALDQIARNPHLSDAGKIDAATELALQKLPKLHELLGKLDPADAAALAQAAQLQKEVAVPDATESDERIAEAFGRKSEQQRIRLLEAAMTGKDPKLAKALATAHHTLHGLGEPTVAILRSQLEGAKLDPEAAEHLKDVALKLGTVRRTVSAIINSLESAADHQRLKAVKVAMVRRGGLSEQEKRDFIDANGLAAFKALPA